MPIAITPLIGAVGLSDTRPYDSTTIANGGLPNNGGLFPVLTTVLMSDGGNATYIRALSEISTYAAVGVYSDGTAQMLTTTLAATTKFVASAQISIPSGYFGWVMRGGKVLQNLAANCAPNVPLYTTATSGVLDDATVSAGIIAGMIATTSISNATAVTCWGSNPHILSVG